MTTVGDSTDPKGTKRPNEDPILVSAHIFKPVVVIERSPKIYFSLKVHPNNVYGIFSLFFTNDILNIFIKNTNKYGALRYQHFKTS